MVAPVPPLPVGTDSLPSQPAGAKRSDSKNAGPSAHPRYESFIGASLFKDDPSGNELDEHRIALSSTKRDNLSQPVRDVHQQGNGPVLPQRPPLGGTGAHGRV